MSGSDSKRTTASARGALHEVRVVELGQLIAGPFCGHLLADHGAEVIKVEAPGAGDPMRRWGGMYKGLGLYWPLLSREKKSVTLDLRQDDGQRLLAKLLEGVDILVENFRPGTLERWGLGWERLQELNPRLILVRVSGYGQTGPYRDKVGFGAIGEAMSGFRYLTGEPGRAPVRCGVSIGDALAATHGLIGALMALYARDRPTGTGAGQLVDVAIYESMWAYMEGLLAEYQKLGTVRQPSGAIIPGAAPSSVYPTSDGEWIVIGANQDNVFKRMAEAMGRPEWAADGSPYRTHLGRGERQGELDALLATWTASRASTEVLRIMEEASVPAGRIYTAVDIAGDEHYRARQMILDVPEANLSGETVATQGVIPKLSATPGRVTRGGPLLGQHNDEIWGGLIGPEELAHLKERGIV